MDVRIAAWLSTPDDTRLEDRPQPLGRRPGEVFTLSSMLKCAAAAAGTLLGRWLGLGHVCFCLPPVLSARARPPLMPAHPPCRTKAGHAVWAEATQGMQSAAAQLGTRRADAARSAALARKMWQLLRTRLRGDVSCLRGLRCGLRCVHVV